MHMPTFPLAHEYDDRHVTWRLTSVPFPIWRFP
jgi:hypothetical protein